MKSATLTQFTIDSSGQTATQRTASSQLDEILGLLNTPAGDRYLFSGRAVDKPATETLDHILNGDGSRAGFKQVMAERLQADLGASGLGRLTLPAITSAAAAMTGAGATHHAGCGRDGRRHAEPRRPLHVGRRHAGDQRHQHHDQSPATTSRRSWRRSTRPPWWRRPASPRPRRAGCSR